MDVGVVFSLTDDIAGWRAVLRHFVLPFKPARIANAVDVYLVVLEQAEAAIQLCNFRHPARANYIFGADSHCNLVVPADAVRVTISPAAGSERRRSLIAAQAAGIVLYDRETKRLEQQQLEG